MNSTEGFLQYEAINVGWVSILPPVVALVLALITKEVISSLLLGCVTAVVIYSIAVLMGMCPNLVKANPIDVLFTVMGIQVGNNIHLCIFSLCMGALLNLLTLSGGSNAYAEASKRFVHGKRPALLWTILLGFIMFLDDYFNAITTGSVMRTLTDINNVSKPKISFIVHTLGTNLCILIPLTSWAASIVAQLDTAGVADAFPVFLQTIPFNLYSILSILFVLVNAIFDLDFGQMQKYEDNAKNGKSESDGSIDKASQVSTAEPSKKGRVFDLIIPLIVFIILSIFFIFYFGGFFEGGISVTDAVGNTDAAKSLLSSSFLAVVSTFFLYVPRKVISFRQWFDAMQEGTKSMLPTLLVIGLAWTISGCSSTLLMTGEYVGNLVRESSIPVQILPAIIFLIGMVMSFATGTSWGTFGILIPIVAGICSEEYAAYLPVSLGACLCGSVFGDNTSPLSDTTILTAASTQCSMLVHCSTQTIYSLTIAAVSFVGYLIAGFCHGNVFITLLSTLVIFALVMVSIWLVQRKRGTKELPVSSV